jgi:oxalate decarboxylase
LQVGGIREPHWHPSAWSAVFGVPAETFSSFKKIDTAIVILRSP